MIFFKKKGKPKRTNFVRKKSGKAAIYYLDGSLCKDKSKEGKRSSK